MKIFRNPEYRGLFIMILVILVIGFVMSVWTGKFEQWTGISLLTGPRALDQIAFVCDRSGSPEICLVKPDGKGVKQLTTGAFVRSVPAVSPSATKIVFVAKLDGKDQVFSVGARGGRPDQLTSATGPKKQPGFTPDGKSLSFISSGKVYRADLNGDSPDTVLPSEAESHAAMSDPLKGGEVPAYYSYAWAPDSTTVVGVTKDTSGNDVVAYLPAPGKPPVMLPLGPIVDGLLKRSGAMKRRIAPDDRMKVTGLVWASAVPAFAISTVSRNDGFLVMCSVQEGKLGVSGFQAFPGHEIGMAAFSLDGGSVVVPIYSTGDKSTDGLVKLDTSNGQLEAVAAGYFMNPSFSPDGSKILVTKLNRKTEARDIVVLDMSTGKLIQLTHDGKSHDAVWTPASKPRESQ